MRVFGMSVWMIVCIGLLLVGGFWLGKNKPSLLGGYV